MHYISEFIHKSPEEFLEVGAYDEEELMSMGKHPAQNVSIELDALSCLRFFPHLERLILKPGTIQAQDLRYLSGLPVIAIKLDYYSDCLDEYSIDLAQFPNLQYVFSRSQYNFRNIKSSKTLCTLVVQEWHDDSLQYLRGSSLHALSIFRGQLKTLDGLQSMGELQSIAVSNQRKLRDATAIWTCTKLESLAFENCNCIDVSILPSLPNLRYMLLVGRNKVRDLAFIKNFPKLEYVILDIAITSGNIDALYCLRHCVILTDHRHYSARNIDLPKSRQRFHSSSIPEWLEILPET